MGSNWSERKYAKDSIPEEDQIIIREKLTLLRELQGITQRDATYANRNSLNKWEKVDISGMKISDLYKLSAFMGWTLTETFAYFAATDVTPALTRKFEKRMAVILKNMPEDFQETACELVETLLNLSRLQSEKPKEKEPALPEVEIYNEPDIVFDLTTEVINARTKFNERKVSFDLEKVRQTFKETY